MSFKFAWLSCAKQREAAPYLIHIKNAGVKCVFLQGDTPYLVSSTITHFGITAPATTYDMSVDDIALAHEQLRAGPDWVDFLAWASANDVPVYYMPDDHEWGGDNWDHTLAQANSNLNIGCTTQAEVNEHFWRGIQAARRFMLDNPQNTDAEAQVGDIPSQALVGDTPPASQYPINYFRVGYDVDGNISDTPIVEFFVPDFISYKDPLNKTDDVNKTLLGATQKAWLKNRVSNSAATFRPIMAPKKFFKNTHTDTGDNFGKYTTEAGEILSFFDAENITGLAWLCGDTHTPSVAQALKTGGAAGDLLQVVACPAGQTNNSPANSSYTNHHVYIAEIADPINRPVNVFGIAEVFADRMEIELCDSNTGSTYWRGRLEAGSNQVQYARPRLG